MVIEQPRHPHRAVLGRQTVPAAIRIALLAILVIAAIASVPFLGEWGPLPTTALVDAWIILFVASCLIWGRIHTTLTLALLSLYTLGRIIPALYNESPAEDFLQANRWLLYLVAFAFAVGRTWGPLQSLIRAMWILLSLAFIKAFLTFAILGPGERPGLFLENNFEIALFVGFIVVLYRFLGKGKIPAVILMGGLTLLGGSRSGAVSFLFLAFFAISQANISSMFVRYIRLLVAPTLVFVPVWIFQLRASQSSSNQIDRLNFLGVFIDETSNWSVLNWAFGTTPITPLSPAGCSHLSYYKGLFSTIGDGSCYSVILHAFILRIVFDAGLLGLAMAFGMAWWMMRRSGVQFGIAATLILVALANSLSVSGLNNPYVALPLLLAIVTATSLPQTATSSLKDFRGVPIKV